MHLLRIVTLICGLFLQVAMAEENTLPLMPYPQDIVVGPQDTHVTLTAGFSISLLPSSASGKRLERAISSTLARYYKQTGLPRITPASKGNTTELQILVEANAGTPLREDIDESYRLSITTGNIRLTANTDVGALRGLETFLQLIAVQNEKHVLPVLEISDAPEFRWRGLMLDSARHFIETETIKRLLHTMASAKLNVFHWHLADDQGWRLPIEGYPALHELASDDLYYRHEDVRDIVALADKLGIRVVPELDFPGHASAIALAYPELMSIHRNYTMERRWGVHKPLLDPTKPQTYAFISAAVAQLAKLFPDEYVHIGGDEVDEADWLNSAHIVKFMQENKLKDGAALQTYFNQRVHEILRQHQRKMIGWDEVAHPELPEDVIIQSWRGHDSVTHTATHGRNVILSTGFYVDQPQYTTYHWNNTIVPKAKVLPAGAPVKHHKIELERLRGAPVKATITLFSEDGEVSGVVDFEGRSRKQLEVLSFSKHHLRAGLDTWMGPTQFRLSFAGGKVTGYAVVGNAGLAVTGQEVAKVSDNAPLKALSTQEAAFVIGAEATLWTENVTDAVVDMRLWPRMYAVAERMWGTADISKDMYRRLQAVSRWAQLSVGTQHEAQREQALIRALGPEVSGNALSVTRLLEPAHYYHRHHLKSREGNYDAYEPLNKLADALAVESLDVIHLDALLRQWLKDPSPGAFMEIKLILNQWQADLELAAFQPVSELEKHIVTAQEQLRLILRLIEMITEGETLSKQQQHEIAQSIASMRQPADEVISALTGPLETLYFHLTENTSQ